MCDLDAFLAGARKAFVFHGGEGFARASSRHAGLHQPADVVLFPSAARASTTGLRVALPHVAVSDGASSCFLHDACRRAVMRRLRMPGAIAIVPGSIGSHSLRRG